LQEPHAPTPSLVALFSFVLLDPSSKRPAKVPQLQPVTEQEQQWASERAAVAAARKAARHAAASTQGKPQCEYMRLPVINHLLLHTLFCCAVLCCAVLCCAVLCCAVLCCAVLCCAVQCSVSYFAAGCALLGTAGTLWARQHSRLCQALLDEIFIDSAASAAAMSETQRLTCEQHPRQRNAVRIWLLLDMPASGIPFQQLPASSQSCKCGLTLNLT
jgi:uncharacterized membrane protein